MSTVPEIPPEAVTAAAEAVNEAHAKRGWNKPQPWWSAEVATAVLEAAAPIFAEAWGVTEGVAHDTQEGTRLKSGLVMRPHPSVPGTPVRRTVTYTPWEEVQDWPDRGAAENGP